MALSTTKRGAVRGFKALAAGAVLVVAPCQAVFAGSYDGSWVAVIPPQGSCDWTSIMTFTVSGTTFEGETRSPGNTEAFTGSIDAAGNGTFLVYRRSSGTITFSNDHFDADWNERTCKRHALGDRAPTRTETAAAYAERKRLQANYTALMEKATEGDPSVNFTTLRSLYPFTDQWDPYGNKSSALLDQAAMASGGGDCATAMRALDELAKIDFTIDAAHAIRSDCLAAAGQPAAATIETHIADELIHSLMDSGDGRTEASAYVVMTAREEMDVLANRHLAKLRQTELRGSKDHLYDVIQVTSPSHDEEVQNVYFDVSSFADGWKSRMAVIETLESGTP